VFISSNLLDAVRRDIGFSVYKHRSETATNEELDEEVDRQINEMTNVELLLAISMVLDSGRVY
jgi:hypothetical protein